MLRLSLEGECDIHTIWSDVCSHVFHFQAMKDFYFHGIPYPSGIDSTNMQGPLIDPENQHVETDNNDALRVGDTIDEETSNCFPSRPSSSYISTSETPSIYFKPCEVFEVSFADMTLSQQHNAAQGLVDGENGRGVALRFPRFIRRRPDKTVEQATTSKQIAEIFFSQSKIRRGLP